MKIRKLNLLLLAFLSLAFASCMEDNTVQRTQAMEYDEIEAALQDLADEGKEVKTAYASNIPFYYLINEAGTGSNVAYGDSVAVKYTMSRLNMQTIDSSEKHFENGVWRFTITEDAGLIRGFKEALLLSRTGASMQFILPSILAYGPYGMPPSIQGYETLVLDLEVDEIVKPE